MPLVTAATMFATTLHLYTLQEISTLVLLLLQGSLVLFCAPRSIPHAWEGQVL